MLGPHPRQLAPAVRLQIGEFLEDENMTVGAELGVLPRVCGVPKVVLCGSEGDGKFIIFFMWTYKLFWVDNVNGPWLSEGHFFSNVAFFSPWLAFHSPHTVRPKNSETKSTGDQITGKKHLGNFHLKNIETICSRKVVLFSFSWKIEILSGKKLTHKMIKMDARWFLCAHPVPLKRGVFPF